VRSPRALAWLFAALLVPLAGIGLVGLRAMALDLDGARARYVEQAATFARAVVEQLSVLAEGLPRDETALAWRASSSLELLEPAARPSTAESSADRGVRESVSTELDAFALAGREDDIDRRLAELAARADRPALAAWALGWIAARAERAGELELARASWLRIIEEFPQARDERGLRRSFAARAELARVDGAGLETLEKLHADALADRASIYDAATAAFATRVAEQIVARAPERATELEQAALDAARPLRFQAAWPAGISDWIARGAPGGTGLFVLPADPALAPGAASRVLVHAERQGEDWSGRALDLEALCSHALARSDPQGWNELGFAAALEDGSGRVLSGSAPSPEAPTASERARDPLGEVLVRAHGTGFAAYESGERRRFLIVACLGAVALLAATAAAFATVRALQREARIAHEREQFVAAVTHELKSPIASIRLLAELLQNGDVDPGRVREFGARTVRESDRLGRLVDSVLRFARGQSAIDPAAMEELDLGELARSAIESVTPLARERGFELRLDAPQAVHVRGDRDALLGALAELVDNATKYGEPAAGVDVIVRRAGSSAELEVLDRGRGVRAAERERIFEPFHRLGDELVRERPGVGLGLALVRGVALAHGGTVTCEARDGGGSRFLLSLPSRTRA
jgi:signal transduction histidine kinase